ICIQAAKAIRNNTGLTSGTTSLAYAAIQLLSARQLAPDARILLLGLGKFGKSIAKNIRTYLPEHSLTLCNRTFEKSLSLSTELGAEVLDYAELTEALPNYEVVIAAIGNQPGLIRAEMFSSSARPLMIDLSVPSVFEAEIRQWPDYYSIDAAAAIVNASLEQRAASIPQAHSILLEHVHEFLEWSRIYAQSHTIQEWKQRVQAASDTCPHLKASSPVARQTFLKRSVGAFVQFVKQQKEASPSSDLLIRDFLNDQIADPQGKPCCLNTSSTPSTCQLCPQASK
ncbi:MAG: hypothetical protein KDC44_00125, partial [Phaeodactylibacter sp.]|nr:hypothetical protein [Phaeodactylibacter sp.]